MMTEILSPREAKARYWRELLAEQAASGKSIQLFCAEHQISQRAFGYWQSKFECPGSEPTVRSRRFIAVSRGDSRLGAPRVLLPNGVTIDLGDDLDSSSVNRFLLSLCGVGLTGGPHAKP